MTVNLTDYNRLKEELLVAVNARKQAERIAQQSESRYKAFIRHAADAIFVFDFDGRFVEVNYQACANLGYSSEELLQMNVTDIVPGLDPAIRRPVWEKLDFNQPYSVMATHRRKDGSIYPVETRLTILNLNGQKLMMALVSDISERKKYEEKQLNLIHQLEEKELAKTRFLASAGHDLRQPVAAASIFVKVLKLSSPTQYQSAMIDKLDESMKTFSDLLDQLLDISKFDAGLIKPASKLFSLADLFDWLEHNFAQAALDKQLQFRIFSPRNESLVLNTDIGLMKSVLMNLLSNAIKFTSHGGVLVSARSHGGRLKLQVWDTGIGISEENISRIFDEFYQVSNSQRDRKSGLGLGLPIVKRALTLLGSEITCRSKFGRGTVFEFRMDIDSSLNLVNQGAATEISLDDVIDNDFTLGKRFVIVEDDTLVGQAMFGWLEGMGAKVQLFSNAEDALGSDQIGQADYFIADYMLGGARNGIQFLNQLRQNLDKPINAVIVTGDTSPAFVQAAEHSDWPVLYKPVNTARLIASLRAQEKQRT